MSACPVISATKPLKMAPCTLLSLDLKRELNVSKVAVLQEVKHAEKKTFPRSEAFDFDVELKKRNAELIVVLDDTGTSGSFALAAYLVYIHTPKLALLHKLCVLEKYRRQGLARNILDFQRQKLATRGCAKIQLWVDERRLPARALYSGNGFDEVGRVENYYGPGRTALNLVLSL